MNPTSSSCQWAEEFSPNLVTYWSLQFISAAICAQVQTTLASAIVQSLIPPLAVINGTISNCTCGEICEVKNENLGRQICKKCGKELHTIAPWAALEDLYDLD